MTTTTENLPAGGLLIRAGQDRFGEQHVLGVNAIDFKVMPTDAPDVLIMENIFHVPAGPPRHLHLDQDEWFYIAEGEFIFHLGDAKFTLRPGDSVLGPRKVPHVWAYTGVGAVGRVVIVCTPAGHMEDFFRKVYSGSDKTPPLDPAFWAAHGMELLGPPLDMS